MKTNVKKNKKESVRVLNLFYMCCFIAMFIVFNATIGLGQNTKPATQKESNLQARVTGLNYICIHVLELEKTLKLYREILGFTLSDAEVLHGKGIEGMLVMKLKANDLTIALSLTAPEFWHTVGPVGNTNHNHIMLKVNDIGPIGDRLKEEGYALENENYVKDKYTFFEGPNGEIIGLSAW